MTLQRSWHRSCRSFLSLAAIALAVAAGVPGERALAGESQALAQAIVKDSGWSRGFCLDLGSDPALAAELARASELSVHRLEADAAAAARARKLAWDAGLTPPRLRIEAGPLDRLEYPDWFANVVVADSLAADDLLRLVRPAGGVAYLRVGAAAPKGFESAAGPGGFTRLRRGPLDGAAEWPHYFCGPDNNRYSPDANIRPPFRPLWYGEPVTLLGDLWLSQALSAGGRLFLTDASPADTSRARITCLDVYNGAKLWTREAGAPRFPRLDHTRKDRSVSCGVSRFRMPGWVMPGEMAVSGERVYLADAGRCLVLDAATGRDVAEFKAPAPVPATHCWRYVAYIGDALYGYADPPATAAGLGAKALPAPAGPGPAVFALDRATGAVRWVRGGGAAGDELNADFPPPLALGADRIFIRAGGNALWALDVRTGKTAWKADVPDEDSWWEGVVHAGKFHLDRFTGRLYGRKAQLDTLVFSAADGGRLEEDGKAVLCDLSRGLCRIPSTDGDGQGGCVFPVAAGKVLFRRNGYALENPRSPMDPRSFSASGYGGFRGACRVPALPANGLVLLPPNSLECHCFPFRAALALEPGAEAEKSPAATPLERFAELPVGEARAAGPSDWPTYRADCARTAAVRQDLSRPAKKAWETRLSGVPTPCIAVGETVFLGSTDECVYALDAAGGTVRWRFHTGGPVRAAPAYEAGRVLAGSDDGWLYCLAAADGRLLWRFRAAPWGRRQVGFGSVVSVWPVHQGLAVDRGVVYLTAGLIPGQGSYGYAVEVVSGKVLWQTPRRGTMADGYLVLGGDRVFLPAEKYYPQHLSRADGKSLPTAAGGMGLFAELAYVAGREGTDSPDRSRGFLVHGGGSSQRGYRQGAGYTGKVRRGGSPYNIFAAPWDSPPNSGNVFADKTAFADGGSFLPLFDEERCFFLSGGELVAVKRAELARLQAARQGKGGAREGFLKWRAGDLPCGTPEWAVLAGGAKPGDPATVLAGGAKGVAAVDAANGRLRWSVELPGAALSPAVARDRVYLASPDGAVRCLAGD